MSELEDLQKAYDSIDRLLKAKQLECLRLKSKIKRLLIERQELEQLVEAHIRLNRELIDLKKKKIAQNEKRRRSYKLKRQETAKISTQTNEKG